MFPNRLRTFLVLASVAFSGLLQAPVSAQNAKESSLSSGTAIVAQAVNPNYPVVNSGDWRSVNPQNIPWSQPVIVSDPFDGNYLAVLDRNYKDLAYGGRASVVSSWSRDTIRVFGFIGVQERCGFFLSCANNLVAARADYLEIKVGNQIFRIQGDGSGSFPVSPQLAVALATAPPVDALIRVTFDGYTHPVTSAIGTGTVRSWKVVYAKPAF
ncbi:MAG: hypothetical protein DCF20_02400 [Pseudanabaena sp.]|nr:MAG: hypothetical protein DCF20_02400 [Pseudanabaena sp.]